MFVVSINNYINKFILQQLHLSTILTKQKCSLTLCGVFFFYKTRYKKGVLINNVEIHNNLRVIDIRIYS